MRLLQFITGIHRIHHIDHSYGWRLCVIGLSRFDRGYWKFTFHHFHNCTASGVY